PDDRRRQAAADLRRLGARVLHRLPQRPSEVRRSVLECRQLGLRREELRRLNAPTVKQAGMSGPASTQVNARFDAGILVFATPPQCQSAICFFDLFPMTTNTCDTPSLGKRKFS